MRRGDTPLSGNHHEPVILVPFAVRGVVVLQFEVAFLELQSVRHERTVVRHFFHDGVDDAALPDEMPLACVDIPADPDAKDHAGVLLLKHSKLAISRWLVLLLHFLNRNRETMHSNGIIFSYIFHKSTVSFETSRSFLIIPSRNI